MKNILLRILIASFLVVTLTDCTQRVASHRGCDFDIDCELDEKCVQEICVFGSHGGTLPIVGRIRTPVYEKCVDEGLKNISIQSSYPGSMSLENRNMTQANFCSAATAFFNFSSAGEQLHAFSTNEGGADIEMLLLDSSGTELAKHDNISNRYEMLAVPLNSVTDEYFLELRLKETDDLKDFVYEMQLRFGKSCKVDDDCAGQEYKTCLMPLWNPEAEAAPADYNNLKGICAPSYIACQDGDGLRDSTIDELEDLENNDSRTVASNYATGKTGWGCFADEDWWSYIVIKNSDLVITFTNTSIDTEYVGEWLIGVYDLSGRLLKGVSSTALSKDQKLEISLSGQSEGTELLIRVFQFHDDPLATYTLQVSGDL